MKNYWHLARLHHWIKNLLVLFPLLCSGLAGDAQRLLAGGLAFLAFSLLASGIYCFNDVMDAASDRENPNKCTRPVASGQVSPKQAMGFAVLLWVLAGLCAFGAARTNPFAWVLFSAYLLLNLGYSLGGKNIPILDIAILAAGFLLRLLYGGEVTDIPLSRWLCLTVISMSFYMGLGKRRNELACHSGRKVLRYYSHSFLDKNMYVCLCLTVVFYAMWAIDGSTINRYHSEFLVWTVPLVILICMKYSLTVEGDSDGDPVEVLLHDRVLLMMVGVFVLLLAAMLYL